MTHRRHGTPSELFSLIPDDEPFTDERERTAEEEALHVVHVGRRPLDDPGRREVDRGYDAREVQHYRYDDEEPEVDDPDRWQGDDEETPDCEELLVIQHYAFDDGSVDDSGTDDGAPSSD